MRFFSELGLATYLGVALIALKATGLVAWSWAWVLSPFWIAAAGYAAVVAIGVAAMRQEGAVATRRPNAFQMGAPAMGRTAS